MSKAHNAATVCMSVRLTPTEAHALRDWCVAHRVSVQDVLRRCVTAATEVMVEEATRAQATFPAAAPDPEPQPPRGLLRRVFGARP